MDFEEYVVDQYQRSGMTDQEFYDKFTHAKRVAALAIAYTGDQTIGRIGLGHDLFEDTSCTPEDMLIIYHEDIVNAIQDLTRRKEETYSDYIDRLTTCSEEVRKVKLYDLLDHLGCTQTLKDSLKNRYVKAIEKLIVTFECDRRYKEDN